MKVFNMRNWFPNEFDYEELSTDEIFIAKGGAEDRTLLPYIENDVVRVLDSPNFDGLILEKKVNQELEDALREPAFAALVDETGSTAAKISPNILYARKEDEDVFYGQEFLQDFSPFTDRNLNTLEDAEKYLDSAGDVVGLNSWLGLAHGDMIQVYPSGPLRGLPKDKNLMFSSKDCVEIDMEDAHFDEETFGKQDHGSGLMQMNVSTSSEEYDALRETMIINTIYRHLPDYFDRVMETDLFRGGEPDTSLVKIYPDDDPSVKEGSYKVSTSKLMDVEAKELGKPNEKLVEDIRRLERSFENGVDRVALDRASEDLPYAPRHVSGLRREIDNYSTIETEIEIEDDMRMSDAARQRWTELYNALEKNL